MIRKALMTGSRVYGTPTEKSDVDVVFLCDPTDIEIFALLADKEDGHHVIDKEYERECGQSFRFGKLNLICTWDDEYFDVWEEGTRQLKQEMLINFVEGRSEVTTQGLPRERAVEVLAGLRKAAGFLLKKKGTK